MKKLLYPYLFPVLILLNSFVCSGSANKQKETAKPRIIVTTDGEIDDKTSFMRFLLYSNEFKIEGLIYGNSKWQKHGHGVVWMQEMIDEYGKIRPNLLKHLPGYPTVEELKKVIYAGNMKEKYLDYSGPLETDGAKHLINNGLRVPENPAYGGWGGRFETKNGHHYFDASDDGDWKKPQWRWLLDIQNDFAARMYWCENPLGMANHYPEIKINNKDDLTAKPDSGEPVLKKYKRIIINVKS